jgi:methylmalonyl-CoA/ethylmalonyl-CoA epimerase
MVSTAAAVSASPAIPVIVVVLSSCRDHSSGHTQPCSETQLRNPFQFDRTPQNQIISQAMLRRLNHVGVVVDDLDEAKRFVGETLGLEFDREVEVPQLGRRVAFFRCGDIAIELIAVVEPALRAQVLAGRKALIEHLAIEVDDIAGTLATLGRLGVAQSGPTLQGGGQISVWTDPDTCDGVIYQLIEKRS